MHKILKYIKAVSILSVSVIFLLYGTLYILLSIPAVQEKAKTVAVSQLSTLTGSDIEIDNIRIQPFNKISLQGILIRDLQKDTLLYANKLSASFDLLPLIHKEVHFTTVQLLGFDARINRLTPEDQPNFQFLADAFASKDTLSKPMAFELRLNSVMLRRGQIRYDVFSQPERSDRFDPNHIAVTNFVANISLRTFSADSLNTHIKRVSFEEKSGFKLDKLSLQLNANRKRAALREFSVKLPETLFAIDSLDVDYRKVESIEQFPDSAYFNLAVNHSRISLADIGPFVPALKHFNSPIDLVLNTSGTINDIEINKIHANYGEELIIDANASLTGISQPSEAYIFGSVKNLSITPLGINTIANNFASEEKHLPGIIENIGMVRFNGEISGFFSNLVAFGYIHTRLGVIHSDLMLGNDMENNLLTYQGKVETKKFNIAGLLKPGNPLGTVSFSLDLDGRKQKGVQPRGMIKGNISSFDFKGYRYENLRLSGLYRGKSFDGSVELADPNGRLTLIGKFDSDNQSSVFNFSADATDIRLDKLKLAPKFKESELSFKLNANFMGNKADNANGEIRMDSLSFSNDGELFTLDRLEISASSDNARKWIRIDSELLSAQIAGEYNFASLLSELRTTLGSVLPILNPKKSAKANALRNDFEFVAKINPTIDLSKTLKLPFVISKPAVLTGYYNALLGLIRLSGDLPAFEIGQMKFIDGSLLADKPTDKLELRLNAQKLGKGGQPLLMALNTNIRDGEIFTKLDWSNLASTTYSGSFATITRFIQQKGKYPLKTEIDICQSNLIFNDSIWWVEPATAVIDSGKIKIDDFQIKHNKQHLSIDGILSRGNGDSLRLNLQDMSLDYIFQTLNLNYIQFGGRGTGEFLLTHHENNPVIKTDSLKVKDFSYNGTYLGDLKIHSNWNNEHKGIYLNGAITKSETKPTMVKGTIFLGNDSLWLNFDANKLNVDFVHVWTDKILQDLGGQATGKITLYGKYKALNVVGDAYAENIRFGIDYLNTTYTIKDTVSFRPDGIFFNNVSVYDKFGNLAHANGKVLYQNFKNIRYDILMNIPSNHNFLVFNVTERQNPVYWGTAFASGSARIYGDVEKTWIDVSMRTKPNTRFNFSLNENLTAGDYKFITFRDKEKERALRYDSINALLTQAPVIPVETGHDIFLNLQVEATPDGSINLIMDPATGDVIKGTGSGNIRLEYNKTTDFRLYGNYTIDKGSYYFNLQDVITRDFMITQGSTVTFRGEPLNSELDIKAIYQVTANLSDLDESFAESKELSRTTVPVQCVLNIKGDLRRPDLNFDINLPTVSQDIDRQVKSIISTDEMMNRQILYLMIINKFYTPDYVNNGQQNRYNELASVASSTLSSQLNNLLGQISDNWNIGTNIRSDKGDFSDVEVELALSSQLLNNRLLFNGNLGYRDNPNANNSFIGDFDLEYLLNKAGSLRLKAYNHYNDRNYSIKSALTTQGVGIMFKKDFNVFHELFHVFKRNKQGKQIPDNMKAEPSGSPETDRQD